jgi:hypothetical protein
MTPGVTDETADSMSLDKIDTLIQAIRQERYQWKPAKRTYIAKKNGKKRPLGLPICLAHYQSSQAMFGIPYAVLLVDQNVRSTILE